MTSTDAADTTDTEAVVETVGGEETAPKDTAHVTESKETKELKEVPKPDLPRLPKPDRRDLDGKVAEMQEAADVQQARIEELKRAIETRRDARKNVGLGSQGTKTRIQELNQQFQQRMVRTSTAIATHPISLAFPRHTPRPPRPGTDVTGILRRSSFCLMFFHFFDERDTREQHPYLPPSLIRLPGLTRLFLPLPFYLY